MTFDLLSAQCFGAVKHSPLARLAALIDWPALRAIVRECNGGRGGKLTGRPAYSDEQLMRLAVLRMVYLCSANQAIEALRVRLDWRAFCRFNLLDDMPEASTLNRFQRELADNGDGLQRMLLQVRKNVGAARLKLVPTRGAPAPCPALKRGSDDGIWTLEGRTGASPYEDVR